MKRTKGFTIVELLTVMGVIAVLIGLLVPALGLVKDYSKRIQQKAQMHSIDVGIEMFKNEFGNYPESKDNSFAAVNPIDSTVYCGANKLAEAMIGWDFLGYHPRSGFTANGYNDVNGDGTAEFVYDTTNGIQTGVPGSPYNEVNGAENIANRKRFIDLENANGFQMQDVYAPAVVTGAGWTKSTNVVLCDVYAKKRLSSKKTGMPILYYRARTGFQFQDYTNGIDDDIYNYNDNINLLALNSPDDNAIQHPLYDRSNDYADFESIILNQQVLQATVTAANPTGVKRPYRADSFFLLSAGKDGLYGTADDVVNFEKEVTE